VLEHRVDGVGLGFGQEADATQIHTQNGYFDVAGQFRGAQEGAVTAENEYEFATFGRAFVGVDHFDFDAE
jgi:hypothetical protein